MRRSISIAVLLIVATLFVTSCARSISPYEAANGRAKCGRTLR